MFDVLSCFEGSDNCNWKWFYQKYFPSRSSALKIFSLAELFIFRNIKFVINRTVPLTSLLTLCILECVYAWLGLTLTPHPTPWLKMKYQGSLQLPQWSKLEEFLVELKSVEARSQELDIIQLCVEEPAGWRNCVAPAKPSPAQRTRQESLSSRLLSITITDRRRRRREMMRLQTADIQHWTAQCV